MNAPRESKSDGSGGNRRGAVKEVTILLVEDERFVRDVAAEILEASGYRVLKARSASEGIKVFRRTGRTLDLLITDVVLPGKNGCGLSEELEVECPELRTIFISGYPEQVVKLEGKSNRVSYLAKPFSVESLTAKVREALEEQPASYQPARTFAGSQG
jgi:two-component system cell cycle sensor histidine kinase/response regulator CckA